MNPLIEGVKKILSFPLIGRLPVQVRSGIAAGARWSLFPWTGYWRGTHEPEIQGALANLMDWRGKSIWDLGSHFGLFAIGLGRRVGSTGFVAAFEPNPESYSRLKLHIQRNQLTWVKPFQIAASDRIGTDRLLLYRGSASTTAHLRYEGETLNQKIPYSTVQLVPLDQLVENGTIRPPDFIKVDVEGHGHKALAGAARTLEACRPIIMMGFHSPDEVEGAKSLLIPLGYHFTPINPLASPDCVGWDFLLQPRPTANG